MSFLTAQIFQPIKIPLHLLLGMLCRNMINGAMRMQFWHSKLKGRNEFLKSIFRLWWVRTRQTQQVTMRARTVRAMVPWSLPHLPLGLPPWDFSKVQAAGRPLEGFSWPISSVPSLGGDVSGTCLAPNRAPGLVCSWQMGTEVRESGGKWGLRHLRAPQVTFVTG